MVTCPWFLNGRADYGFFPGLPVLGQLSLISCTGPLVLIESSACVLACVRACVRGCVCVCVCLCMFVNWFFFWTKIWIHILFNDVLHFALLPTYLPICLPTNLLTTLSTYLPTCFTCVCCECNVVQLLEVHVRHSICHWLIQYVHYMLTLRNAHSEYQHIQLFMAKDACACTVQRNDMISTFCICW